MAKSKPIGVRFDLDMLEAMAEDKIADSPQKALNFLSAFWKERRDKIIFSEKFADIKLKSNPPKEEKKEKSSNNNPQTTDVKVNSSGYPADDPKEGSMAFFKKYGYATYEEVEKALNNI